MLDQETKRRIDSCRDMLVGKIPDPKSQVEQITIALIYKFMDDMDKESVEMGGKASFFTGDYAKYSWTAIFDPRIGGHELTKLYGEAIEKMNQNPNIPQLFRDIFKNAYLPYRDPETLKLFLKEINNFDYSHSEKLGDAFEYLLSFMGTQGDAGQFRTPRHIIDFIAEAVNPQKHETILDPACGTAGFLISAYKHILKANDNGKKLTPTERKRMLSNFTGYDISPDMVRLSLVNLYLHGFQDPKILEYDTLTSEERWNESVDVILANPPFMTPKGGIRPHKRFSIQAKRSEVLFVDYIAEHLNPNGRAGIIVPEGIIFQSSNAYKNLRKMLIEDYLWAVVSLPAGVFQPYSGVKTSILFLDKTKAKQNDSILFVKVENDGFDLGAQRRPVDKNDLPEALRILGMENMESIDYVDGALTQSMQSKNKPIAHWVEKTKIAESGDWNLSGVRYRVNDELGMSNYEMVNLGDVSHFIGGYAFKSSDLSKIKKRESQKAVVKIGNVKMKGEVSISDIQFHDYEERFEKYIINKNDILIAMTGATVGKVAMSSYDDLLLNQRVGLLRAKSKVISQYFIYNLLHSDRFYNFCQRTAGGGAQGNISPKMINEFQIPLPPLSVQEEIVAEIDGYQKIIDGARQVVNNYKPTIKIDPDWGMVKLGKIAKVKGGFAFKSKEFVDSGIQVIKMGNVKHGYLDLGKSPAFMPFERKNAYDDYILSNGDIIITMTGTAEKRDYGEVCLLNGEGQYLLNQRVGKIEIISEIVTAQFLYLAVSTDVYQNEIFKLATGVRQANISGSALESIPVPLPPLSIQKEIVAQIEVEQEMVNGNKKLIEIYEQKIKDKIGEVWGEE
ncbi:MAG: N-6 DNA methylase [Candidatus Marinimicrobia bacterium]|nr:N-6 DNA methylase [Candidatus Neomarinimicrobiota bacterium]